MCALCCGASNGCWGNRPAALRWRDQDSGCPFRVVHDRSDARSGRQLRRRQRLSRREGLLTQPSPDRRIRPLAGARRPSYEQDFIGFSYGFRPGKSAHNALDAVAVGVGAQASGLDTRCGHSQVLRHDRTRLAGEVHRASRGRRARGAADQEMAVRGRAGGRADQRSELGTVQGGSISPLLANIYLHYAFDLWAEQWRRVMPGATWSSCATPMTGWPGSSTAPTLSLQARGGRAARTFGLALHENKTRLIEFGRFARETAAARAEASLETFDFLGFTHCCGKTRKGSSWS